MRTETHTPLYLRALRDQRTRLAIWALALLIFVAVFADFIANDKPLYCQKDGVNSFPAFHDMAGNLGLASRTIRSEESDWWSQNYDRVIFAPVPYSALQTDLKNANFKGPFVKQNVSRTRFRHWLGTDQIGRDVLAGLVHGSRIALVVGILSMFLAGLIGIPVGAVAGYLGNDRGRIRRFNLCVFVVACVLSIYFVSIGITAGGYILQMALMCIVAIAILAFGLWKLRGRFFIRDKEVVIPVDSIVLRSIEIIRSIPAFFLIFAILGMVKTPKLSYVILLIAALWSPSIIRYVRAEAMKLRNQTFVQSAMVLGLTHKQIVWRHIIPNAIGPAMITIAFGVGSAVLIESALSFLGIGIAPDTISWGKMLNLARNNFSAWWMALLPGAAIFITIAIFNRLGDVYESLYSGRG